jgi:hypothetical protein
MALNFSFINKIASNRKLLIVWSIIIILCLAGVAYYLSLQSGKVKGTSAVPDREWSLSEVKTNFYKAKNYRFSYTTVNNKTRSTGEFHFPNSSKYLTTSPGGGRQEIIAIDGTVYMRSKATGNWAKTTDKTIVMDHHEKMSFFFDHIDMNTKPNNTDSAFWVFDYTNSADQSLWQMSVNKKNGYPIKLVINSKDAKNQALVETYNYTGYDTVKTEIKAPI